MKSKLQIKKEIEKEIDKSFRNKVRYLYYKGHEWNYWSRCHIVAEAKLSQLKEDTKEELFFLDKLHKILNNHHSQIPFVEVGRQNVLNDVDNRLKLDKRIKKLKEVLK